MDKYIIRSSSTSSLISKRSADEEAADWRIPKRHATVKSHDKFDTNRDLPIQNQFHGLSVDKEADSGDKLFKVATTTAKKIGHIPPIILDLKSNWSHEEIKDIISKYSNRYNLQYRNGNKVAVICHTTEAHQAVKEGLRKEDIAFITYTRKDEKRPKAVIKGIPSCFENDLPAELNKLGFGDCRVTILKSRRQNNTSCPPFLVQLSSGVDIVRFRQIKYLFNCVVTIHKFKPNNSEGTQCFRCQNFGHSARNCNMPARCVKCTGTHATIECSKKDRQESARCCNCNENHPANYKKCSARTAYLQRLHQKKEAGIKFDTQRHISKKVDNSKSWAQVAAIQITSPGDIQNDTCRPPGVNSKPLTLDSLTSPSEDPTIIEMYQILLKIRSLKSEFVTCSSPIEKVMLVLNHLSQYV